MVPLKLMRKPSFSLILVAALALSGCKADAGSRTGTQMAQGNLSPAPSSVVPAAQRDPLPAHDPRPVLVCFGDSLTAGFGAADGASYPDFLQTNLDKAGYHYRVVNEGVSGDTTKDGVDRLSDVLALHPMVVVLEFGGNDGLRGLKVETTRQNLTTMIKGLQDSGAKVVLAGITLPPDYGPDYIHSFTANYTTLARQFHTPLLPFLLQNVYGVPGMMQADRTHATEQGNSVVAQNLLPYVEPLLGK